MSVNEAWSANSSSFRSASGGLERGGGRGGDVPAEARGWGLPAAMLTAPAVRLRVGACAAALPNFTALMSPQHH